MITHKFQACKLSRVGDIGAQKLTHQNYEALAM